MRPIIVRSFRGRGTEAPADWIRVCPLRGLVQQRRFIIIYGRRCLLPGGVGLRVVVVAFGIAQARQGDCQ